MKIWVRLFKYTRARIGIRGTKRLHKFNPYVRKLIWVFPGASYSFHVMAEHKDGRCNLQWYIDQFYKPRHKNFSQRGCHSMEDFLVWIWTQNICGAPAPPFAAYELNRGSFMFYGTHKQLISAEKITFSRHSSSKTPFFKVKFNLNVSIISSTLLILHIIFKSIFSKLIMSFFNY